MPPPSDTSAVFLEGYRQPEYSPAERQLLCSLAHEAIVSLLEERALPEFTPSEHLSQARGVFTTLYRNGRLRGCVGYPTALAPLHQAVIETARAAAFEDPRFPPVTLAEARDLAVSISVLGPLQAILPEHVEVGRHGLVISHGSHRGLLLPQVAAENAWDRVTFLEQTCRKAGLALDAWRTGAAIEAFTAEVFGDGTQAVK
jgi:AmmeMemoRadiSam system protein A